MTDALEGWRGAGKTFRFGEHAVFYRSGGRAEPGATLLCIHGLPTLRLRAAVARSTQRSRARGSQLASADINAS